MRVPTRRGAPAASRLHGGWFPLRSVPPRAGLGDRCRPVRWRERAGACVGSARSRPVGHTHWFAAIASGAASGATGKFLEKSLVGPSDICARRRSVSLHPRIGYALCTDARLWPCLSAPLIVASQQSPKTPSICPPPRRSSRTLNLSASWIVPRWRQVNRATEPFARFLRQRDFALP